MVRYRKGYVRLRDILAAEGWGIRSTGPPLQDSRGSLGRPPLEDIHLRTTGYYTGTSYRRYLEGAWGSDGQTCLTRRWRLTCWGILYRGARSLNYPVLGGTPRDRTREGDGDRLSRNS